MDSNLAQSILPKSITESSDSVRVQPNTRHIDGRVTGVFAFMLTDLALLTSAALLGHLANVYWQDLNSQAPHAQILWILLAFVVISAIGLIFAYPYPLSGHHVLRREWPRGIGTISFVMMLLWSLTAITAPQQLAPAEVVVMWAAAVVAVPAGRKFTQWILLARGIGRQRLLLIASPCNVGPILKQLSMNKSSCQVTGLVITADRHDAISGANGLFDNQSDSLTEIPIADDIGLLPNILSFTRPSDVLIAVPNSEYAAVQRTVRNSVPAGITVRVALDPLLDDAGKMDLVAGISTVSFKRRIFSWQYESVKRGFDITASVAALIVFSFVMAVIAVAIKLESPGPVLFKQIRVGRNGQLFSMYKFRSMKVNAEALLQDLMQHNEASGAMFKMRNDPRVTRVGMVIRKLSLDELPQLFNVLGGSMSLVGPRPPLPKEVEEYELWHFQRLEGVPGITGLWQVSRGPEVSFDEMVRLDLDYLRDWSVSKDIVILFKTFPVVLTGRGAY